MNNHGTTRRMIMAILKEGPATRSRLMALTGCKVYQTLYHLQKAGVVEREGIIYSKALTPIERET